MLTDITAVVLLLLTGIVALLSGIFLLLDYLKNKKVHHLLWAISFLVLFLAGLLIIIVGWTILFEPIIPVITTLIPAFLAVGLLYVLYPEKPVGLYYLLYSIIFMVVQLLARYDIGGLSGFASLTLMAVHIPSGLIIVFLPIIAALKKDTEMTAILFSLGGITISLGGILLAFTSTPSPILTLDQIIAVLPILLLIVGLLFFLGVFMPSKWRATNPVFK